jgi:outer membrane autotransporter protein
MVAGLLVGYGHTDVSLNLGGSMTGDGGEVGLYGLYYSEGFFADALVEGGLNSYGTQRQAYNGTATGSTQGQEYDGVLGLGYQWNLGKAKLGPVASAQYSKVLLNGFTEQGSMAPLTLPNQSQDSLLTQLSLEFSGQWSLNSSTLLNPSLQLGWEHEYNNKGSSITAGFGTGDSFTVAGPQVGQDGLLAGLGVNLTFSKTLAFALTYQGELGRTNLNSTQLGAGAKVGF